MEGGRKGKLSLKQNPIRANFHDWDETKAEGWSQLKNTGKGNNTKQYDAQKSPFDYHNQQSNRIYVSP